MMVVPLQSGDNSLIVGKYSGLDLLEMAVGSDYRRLIVWVKTTLTIVDSCQLTARR
jgi:hypothetical protein